MITISQTPWHAVSNLPYTFLTTIGLLLVAIISNDKAMAQSQNLVPVCEVFDSRTFSGAVGGGTGASNSCTNVAHVIIEQGGCTGNSVCQDRSYSFVYYLQQGYKYHYTYDYGDGNGRTYILDYQNHTSPPQVACHYSNWFADHCGHNYPQNNASYSATLNVQFEDPQGNMSSCQFNASATITLNEPESVDPISFNYNSSCNTNMVNFTADDPTGCMKNGYLAVYNWGDGTSTNIGNTMNFSHTYQTAGSYIVTLTVSANTQAGTLGASATTTKTVVIPTTSLNNPTFSWNANCSLAATFAGTVTGDCFNHYNVVWDWGDGATNTYNNTANAAHTYANAGTYVVGMTVNALDASGGIAATKTFYDQVKVITTNAANFTYQAGCAGTPSHFAATPMQADVYSWGISGITTPLGGPNPSTTLAAGTYTVNVTVTNNIGGTTCSSISTDQTVVIQPAPTISITAPTEACAGDVQLTANVANATNVQWNYDNPMGITNGYGFGPNIITYPSPAGPNKHHTITATATNGNCSATATHHLEIKASPAVTMNPAATSICPGQNSILEPLITNYNPNFNYLYSWDNGSTYSKRAVTSTGTYTVKVSNGVCSTTGTKTLTAINASNYGFTYANASCGNSDVTITGAGITNVDWSRDPINKTSALANQAPGSITAAITVNGCIMRLRGTVPNNEMLVTITTVPAACAANDGTASVTSISGGSAPYTFNWSNSATTNSTNSLTAGSYTVKVTDVNGCSVTRQVTINKKSLYVSSKPASACGNTAVPVHFQSKLHGATGTPLYTYSFAGNNNANQSHPYAAGSYTITVTATGGCTQTHNFTVQPGSALTTTLDIEDAACEKDGQIIAKVNGGQGPFDYKWTGNRYGGLIKVPDGNYTVTVTDQRGCTSTATGSVSDATGHVQIIVPPDPAPCDQISAEAIDGTPPYKYSWYQIEAFDPNDWSTPIPNDVPILFKEEITAGISYADNAPAGIYEITVTDKYGCSATDMVMIEMNMRNFSFDFTFKRPEPYVSTPIITDDAADVAYDALDDILDQASACVAQKAAEIKQDFGACLDPNTLDDDLSLSYDDKTYTYTLYYYDRMGNLTKTVPPQGVDELNATELTNTITYRGTGSGTATKPSHTMTTTYDYNSLGQLIKQATPDGGTTEFLYTDIGQLRFSQNAKQAGSSEKEFSYTKYDKLGRVIESGQSGLIANSMTTWADLIPELSPLPPADPYLDFPPSAGCNEVVRTYYTDAATDIDLYGEKQSYLKNRVSYVMRDEDGDFATTADQSATYYSYDPHGNVKWLIQKVAGFTKGYIEYDYELVSGNVKQVTFNRYRKDKFYHRYNYDADNRITNVQTSRDGHIWDTDASYDYYAHGPLKRTVLGQDKVQGLDYTYTLQGWLKGINTPQLLASVDPGHDEGLDPNSSQGFNNGGNPVLADVFGMSLDYYNGDFMREHNGVMSSFNSDDQQSIHQHGTPPQSMYNGNIAAWRFNTDDGNTGNVHSGQKSFTYKYDKLNRLIDSDFWKYNSTTQEWKNRDENYNSDYTYDLNGNIITLNRNAYQDASGGTTYQVGMDALVYNYQTGTNKLLSVEDLSTSNSNGRYQDIYGNDEDIRLFEYDETGNLTKETFTDYNGGDLLRKEHHITWNNSGKVASVKENLAGTTEAIYVISFNYDAAGNRVMKKVHRDDTDWTQNYANFYLRDAQGNPMGTYKLSYEEDNGNYEAVFRLIEFPIYGSDRVGQVNLSEESGIEISRQSFDPGAPHDLTFENDGISRKSELENYLVATENYITTGAEQICSCELNEVKLDNGTTKKLALSGITANNIAIAEDDNGVVQFYAAGVKDYMGNTGEQMLIFAADGTLMKGATQTLKGNIDADAVIMQDAGDPQKYNIYTNDVGNGLVYHTVDMSKTGHGNTDGLVIGQNQSITSATGAYGLHLAGYQNGLTGKHILYATKYTAPPATGYPGAREIVAFPMSAGASSPQSISLGATPSYDATGNGEIQLSKDGKKLLSYNHLLQVSGYYHRQLEITVFDLDHTGLQASQALTSTLAGDGAGNYGEGSASFATQAGTLNYSQRGVSLKQPIAGTWKPGVINDYGLVSQVTSLFAMDKYGNVRRGADQVSDYVTQRTSQNQLAKERPSAAMAALNFTGTTDFEQTGYLPNQTIKVKGLPLDGTYQRTVGEKLYELKDHLGNVRATVNDYRLTNDFDAMLDPDDPANFQTAAIASTSDYYPFGMQMPGRSYSSNSYSHGFNGQIKDDEIKGSGNSLNYKYRMYDTRIARFFATDPVTHHYPYWTPYQFAGNMPIKYLDAEGLQPGERAFMAGMALFSPNAYQLEVKFKQLERERMGQIDPMEAAHFTLDGFGMVPVVGEAADGINGGLYLLEGRYMEAGMSFTAMVPIAGWFATGAKWTQKAVTMSRKYGDNVADLVQSTVRRGEQGAKEIFTITKSGSFKDAKAVMNDMVDLGDDAVDYVGRKGPFEGKVAGQTSANGKSGYRIDWDDKSGAHINWWNGKEKGAIPFTGDLEQAQRVVANTLGN